MVKSDYDPKTTGPQNHLIPNPYQEVDWIDGSAIPETVGADILFTAIGKWPEWFDVLYPTNDKGHDALKKVIEFAYKPFIFPTICKLFVQDGESKTFWDYWYTGLPMDNQMGDKIMPVWFTEMWITIDQSQEVMNALKNYYAEDEIDILKPGYKRAGNFSVEIYAAKKSQFWMSPAYYPGDDPEHAHDVLRIDIFWFANSNGDPAQYYQQFWDLLRPFNFRPHWAKYFPDPSKPPAPDTPNATSWKGYLKSVYDKDKWARWMDLREQNDPGKIFLNDYWSAKLEI